jgi:hypothetical protein
LSLLEITKVPIVVLLLALRMKFVLDVATATASAAIFSLVSRYE